MEGESLRNRLPALAGLILTTLLSGCHAEAIPPVPDLEPVGSGLRFLGIGLVVMALVFVLGTTRD